MLRNVFLIVVVSGHAHYFNQTYKAKIIFLKIIFITLNCK